MRGSAHSNQARFAGSPGSRHRLLLLSLPRSTAAGHGAGAVTGITPAGETSHQSAWHTSRKRLDVVHFRRRKMKTKQSVWILLSSLITASVALAVPVQVNTVDDTGTSSSFHATWDAQRSSLRLTGLAPCDEDHERTFEIEFTRGRKADKQVGTETHGSWESRLHDRPGKVTLRTMGLCLHVK
jgi:hypothetical protein